MRITIPIFLVSGLFAFSAFAEPSFKEIKTLPLKEQFGTEQDWHITAYQLEGKDVQTGDISAKLCFWFSQGQKQKHCTSIISHQPNDRMVYQYQTVKELSVIAAPHLVKLIAEFSGGGSGILDQVSFWQYDRSTDAFVQAGQVRLTEQGEYKLLDDGTLVIADAHWGEGETHFSAHRFYIEAYAYTPNTGYAKAFTYLTSKKYPSLDDTNKINVIANEMPEISKRLKSHPEDHKEL